MQRVLGAGALVGARARATSRPRWTSTATPLLRIITAFGVPRPGALAAAIKLRGSMQPAGLPASHAGIDADAIIRRESDFYGRTVNIAARLAALAGPDEILATAGLVRAVRDGEGDLPRLVELPPVELKGLPEPIRPQRLAD